MALHTDYQEDYQPQGYFTERLAEDEQRCKTRRALNLSTRWLVLQDYVWIQTLRAVKLNIGLVEHHWPDAFYLLTGRVTIQISR
jgi:hypothetical protein